MPITTARLSPTGERPARQLLWLTFGLIAAALMVGFAVSMTRPLRVPLPGRRALVLAGAWPYPRADSLVPTFSRTSVVAHRRATNTQVECDTCFLRLGSFVYAWQLQRDR
jgi:hypothetical protein